MKFKKLEIDYYPSSKVGDFVDIDNRSYQVIGYTDAGTRLLVQIPGEFEVFKLVKRSKKEQS